MLLKHQSIWLSQLQESMPARNSARNCRVAPTTNGAFIIFFLPPFTTSKSDTEFVINHTSFAFAFSMYKTPAMAVITLELQKP